MNTLFQIFESFRFAWKALRSNMLRTILSLLGVTIGIFAIIFVHTMVDSLEKNIKDSLNFLGSDVIYVDKWPFTAEEDGEYRWWDFWMRPNPSVREFEYLDEALHQKSSITIFGARGGQVFRRGSNAIKNVRLMGGGRGYNEVFEVNVESGRYFTPEEISSGRNVALVGYEVTKVLFPDGEDPVGKQIKIKNMKFTVVGTIKKEGGNFLGAPSNDFTAVIPYQAFRRFYQTGTGAWDELTSRIAVKGHSSDIGLVELENELRGALRVRRGLRPVEKDNFALNRPEAIANIVSSVFDVFGIGGWIIGGFSMLVGGFGIANIMFVSVKERTSIIGLQKSLGAKNYFILFQFLFESIFLSLIGGFAGLFIVYLCTFIPMGSLEVSLSVGNTVLGIGVSTAIGVISGIVPAAMAARLDPVAAIRST